MDAQQAGRIARLLSHLGPQTSLVCRRVLEGLQNLETYSFNISFLTSQCQFDDHAAGWGCPTYLAPSKSTLYKQEVTKFVLLSLVASIAKRLQQRLLLQPK